MNLKLIKTVALFTIASFLLLLIPRVNAAHELNNPRDMISTRSLNSFSQHSIRFGLPVSSTPVSTSDFIFLDLPYFSGITEPNYIAGEYTGTPTFVVIGTRVRIAGISMLPGSYITIQGMTAYNPESYDQFDVYIFITSDIDGFNVRNESHIIATVTDGSVVVSATLRAEVGTLRINGKSSPGMFITFTEGGTVKGTAIADQSGNFSQLFPGITPIVHTILIFGIDSSDRVTPSTIVEVLPRAYEVTTVNGIVLPPTVSLDKEQISRGETITISGTGIPGYKAIIFCESPLNTYEAMIDAGGNYSHTVSDTTDMEYGDHKVYALVQDINGDQSMISNALFYRVVNDTPVDPGESPECEISQGDLNCDDTINLVDFSILLYYWGSNNLAADINNDSIVNLIDFSIMMFYWEG